MTRAKRRVGGKISTHLERLIRSSAATEAGLIATSGVDQPILRLGSRGKDGLPVVQGQVGDTLLGNLLSQLLNRVLDGGCCRHVGLDLVEPPLHAVGEGNLLLGHGQGREEGDERRETHLEG